jgi:hypothetical protein
MLSPWPSASSLGSPMASVLLAAGFFCRAVAVGRAFAAFQILVAAGLGCSGTEDSLHSPSGSFLSRIAVT